MICDFENEHNDDELYTCNSRTGQWVLRDSEEGILITANIDNEQPNIINTVINGRARILKRIGHNNYALITNHQPKKIYNINDEKLNKKYCGNNSNIYDMMNYVNNINEVNPYKYSSIDNLYNCLKKGIYIGRNIPDADADADL